jgi:hypothetical protein
MNELTPIFVPQSLECNGSTDLSSLQAASLQVTVQNTTAGPLDLSNSGLRIEFPVDGGGDTSTSALLMSQYSGRDAPPTGTALQPLVNVEAMPELATSWDINPTDDGTPCAFLATPQPGAGQLGPGNSLSFGFANLVVNLVPGSSQVDVTVVAGGGISATVPAPIVKTPAPVAIQTFNATPLGLEAPNNQSSITWVTSGVESCELAWSPDTTTVTYNGEAQTSPWSPAPWVVSGASPVTATLDSNTNFTLTAIGATSLTQQLLVSLSEPTLTAPLTVSPTVPFELTWKCYTGSDPVLLTWSSLQPLLSITDLNGNSLMDATAAGQTKPLPTSGSALVEILVPTTFDLQLGVPIGGGATRAVGVYRASIKNGHVASQEADPTTGLQSVTLAWEAENATSFLLQGSDGTSLSIAPGQVPTVVLNGLSSFSIDLPYFPQYRQVSYTVTAVDYVTMPSPFPTTTIPVTPLAVTLSSASSSAVSVDPTTGIQTVTLMWQASNVTEFAIFNGQGSSIGFYAGYMGSVSSGPSNVTVTLPANNVQYEIVAIGYLPTSTSLGVYRVPVQLNPNLGTARSTPTKSGQTLTLSWQAQNATGFTVSGPNVSAQLGATVRQVSFPLGGGGTYTVTAHGLPEPSASVAVGPQTYPKEKDKDKEKERKELFGMEKFPRIEVVRPFAPSHVTDLPSGPQRAFIDPEQRAEIPDHIVSAACELNAQGPGGEP